MKRKIVFLFLTLSGFVSCFSEELPDTAKQSTFLLTDDDVETKSNLVSYSVFFTEGRVLGFDKYVRSYLKEKETRSLMTEVSIDTYVGRGMNSKETQWTRSAKDYNYPTFSFGLRYNFNHGTMLHRDNKDWPGKEVDYNTHLGDVITLYGRFLRPVFRTSRWTGGYYLGTGVGYSMSTYDTKEHIDNELIGTHFNIFFTVGAYIDYRLSKDFRISAGLDFAHHSNGALYRPNKGANYLGPFVGLKYVPQAPQSTATSKSPLPQKEKEEWQKHPLFLEISLGVGAKSLDEDWQLTQFRMKKGDPDYRTDKFSVYGAFSLQTDVLYRYARRWASGLGFDVFYGDYSDKVARVDQKLGCVEQHYSPWSFGIAIKHEAFYGPLSARVGIGKYVYRHMGGFAKHQEASYYERIGLFYSFSKLQGMSIGFSVKAHKTKADFTELQLAFPIHL